MWKTDSPNIVPISSQYPPNILPISSQYCPTNSEKIMKEQRTQ